MRQLAALVACGLLGHAAATFGVDSTDPPHEADEGSALSIEPGATSGLTILRECPEGSLLGQPLDDSFFTANTSDAELSFAVSEALDPSQLPIGAAVGFVRFWGLSIQFDDESGSFVATCNEDDATPFDFAFFEDNGVPNDFTFGDQIAARTTTPTVFDTAIAFAFTTIVEYDATMAPAIGEPESIAWTQIVRQTGNSVPDGGGTDPCLFLWVNTLAGYGEEARQDGAVTPEIIWDFALCLAPAAAGGCFTVLSSKVTCHPDGETFTVDVEGINECTGALMDFSHTATGGAPGDDFCFTVTINDAGGGLCCTQTICTIIPHCPEPAQHCDVDGDDVIDVNDLFLLLAAWGSDPGGPPDFDLDGNVGASDLLTLVANWGPCQ